MQASVPFTPTTPKASPDANKPTPAPSPPKQQREFLKGMSPSSSSGGGMSLGPSPVTPEPANVLAATGTPPPTVSHETGSDIAPESDGAVTLVGVASSNSGRQSGEAETGAIKDETEKEEGRTSRKRSIKLVSQPGEPQVETGAVSRHMLHMLTRRLPILLVSAASKQLAWNTHLLKTTQDKVPRLISSSKSAGVYPSRAPHFLKNP